jgi:hypothetical protein
MATLVGVLGELPGEDDPQTRGLLVWARLHGFAGLELGGNFASMGVDAGQLFERELDDLA